MLRTAGPAEAAEPVKPTPVIAPPKPVQPAQPVEAARTDSPLELVRDEPQESGASVVDSGRIQLDPAMQTRLTVSSARAPELAATPLDWMASAPPPPAVTPEEEIVPMPEALEEDAPEASAVVADPAPPAKSELAPMHAATSKDAKATEPVADATPPPDPDLVIASGLHEIAPPIADAPEAESKPAELALSESKLIAAEIPSGESAGFGIPSTQAWAAITAQVQVEARKLALANADADAAKSAEGSGAATAASSGASNSPEEPATKTPDPALIEAVVARILDRMQPQVMDIVTKEFLRPIVQALVDRELDKR
ncbi:MAG: hypothetical protein WBP79_06260, partial [Candidatus Acidiferrales bacterium]